ncbi:MAG: hypothetical protein HY046_01175 [Acidobacteria bacterium]|nr:hypothetical protein [Acidobacteriota bacterium]
MKRPFALKLAHQSWAIRAALGLCFCAGGTWAQTPDPAQMPARQTHEGLTIAVDPYLDAARVKLKFGKKHPYDADIMPVEVFFKNDTDQAVRVTLEEVRLLISPPEIRRQRLEPLDFDTVIERTLHEEKGGPEVKKPRVPLPIPRSKKDRGKEWKKLEELWGPFLISSDVLPPKSVVRGFLFFDMGRHMDWAVYSRLLVPKLSVIGTNKDLFYFEVDLSKAVPKP